jgi:SurA N-terminal domain
VKANRLVLLAVAGTSVLALTGCTQTGNVAAKVGDTTVPTSEVDFLARMQCTSLDKAAKDPAQAGSVQVVSTSQIRTSMVNTLIQTELNRQLAEEQDLGYDKTTLRNAMQQFASVLQTVPAKDRDRFHDLVESIYRGQLEVYSLAQSKLAAQGVTSPSQQQVDEAISKIQDDYRKTVDIDVNPAYGADADGVAGSQDPSLSTAVSSFAKQSRKTQPDPSWVSKLPADERCG